MQNEDTIKQFAL
jgi:hypothetical protein